MLQMTVNILVNLLNLLPISHSGVKTCHITSSLFINMKFSKKDHILIF